MFSLNKFNLNWEYIKELDCLYSILDRNLLAFENVKKTEGYWLILVCYM